MSRDEATLISEDIKPVAIAIINFYRTLRGRDQREKCALNATKHTFQANSALLTTKSALTAQ